MHEAELAHQERIVGSIGMALPLVLGVATGVFLLVRENLSGGGAGWVFWSAVLIASVALIFAGACFGGVWAFRATWHLADAGRWEAAFQAEPEEDREGWMESKLLARLGQANSDNRAQTKRLGNLRARGAISLLVATAFLGVAGGASLFA